MRTGKGKMVSRMHLGATDLNIASHRKGERRRTAGDEHLQGKMAVNDGRKTEKEIANEKRSGRKMISSGSRRQGLRGRGKPDDDGTLAGARRLELEDGDRGDEWGRPLLDSLYEEDKSD